MACTTPKLVLASASPRRRQLLAAAGYDFRVVVPAIDEATGLCSNCGPAEMVAELSRRKAADVVQRCGSEECDAQTVVVACDTLVECGGQILGKPIDEDHAREMLRLLAGREHRVYSGLCLWPLAHDTPDVRVAVTALKMDQLSDQQREAYLAGGQWEGKAGAFGYQDQLGWVHVLRGSESNVVGLPMELLKEMLAGF